MELDEFPDRVVLHVASGTRFYAARGPVDSPAEDAEELAVSLATAYRQAPSMGSKVWMKTKKRQTCITPGRPTRTRIVYALTRAQQKEKIDATNRPAPEGCPKPTTTGCEEPQRSPSTQEGARYEELEEVCVYEDEESEEERRLGPVATYGRCVPLPKPLKLTTLQQEQQKDDLCASLAEAISTPATTPTWVTKANMTLFSHKDVVCIRQRGANPKIVMPTSLRYQAIHAHHLSYYAGHVGLTKTHARLALRYWWPSMGSDVKRFMKRCTHCMAYTHVPPTTKWLSLPIGSPL